jgi:hypothetical protein
MGIMYDMKGNAKAEEGKHSMGNHRETQCRAKNRKKGRRYKPKSWVINKVVRFWGFVIVVTAAPAILGMKESGETTMEF